MSVATPAAPVVSLHHHLTAAAIGRSGRTQVVYIEEPAWCTEDHLGEPVGNVEDVMHRGDQSEFCINSLAFAPIPHQLYAYLASDPVAADPRLRATYIAIDNADGSQSAFLTPEMAETMADNAVRFAEEVRALARGARRANCQANQAT